MKMVKNILCKSAYVAVFVCFGCGQSDLNKNLKPVPADAKPPKMAKEGAVGGNPDDKPRAIFK
jgi:hypothetical protein